LIGAKNAFIVRPFLYSGIWYGFLGALFAVLFVNLFLMSLSFAVSQLATVYQMHYALLGLTLRQMLFLLGFAVSLGWLGACLSVKKQLAAIEPC
jgi:cell division transport system permease protein